MEEKVNQILYKRNIIQPLKGFCTTIEEGNIVKAAEKLHLTQATITRQIQSLERDLGEELFDRTGKTVLPTEKALRFYDIAIKRVEGMETLFADFLTGEKIEDDNTIRVAATHHILEKFLPKYIFEYSKINKNIKFELFNVKADIALNKLKNYELDLCLYPKNSHNNGSFIHKVIFKSEAILVIPKNHYLVNIDEKNITMLDTFKDFINMGNNITFDFYKKAIDDYEFEQKIMLMENANWNWTIELVRTGNGITGVYDFFLKNIDKTGLIFKNIKHLYPDMQIEYITNHKNIIKSNVKEFVKLLCKQNF